MSIIAVIKEKLIVIASILINEDIITEIDIKNISVNKVQYKYGRGELSTNFAFIAKKNSDIKTIDIARRTTVLLNKDEICQHVEVAGGGFINITLHKKVWYEFIDIIINTKEEFCKSNIGVGKKINLEYVSANPTGPMHIGHARNAVIGSVLAKILSFIGYKVTQEYIINDAGVQIKHLCDSVYYRYIEQCGITIDIKNIQYKGEYLIDIAKKLYKKYENKLQDLAKEELNNIISEFTLSAMMQLIKNDLHALGINHDNFISEKELHKNNDLIPIIDELTKKGYVYKGVLDIPQGKKSEDWKAREQLLFKSTIFGDDVDRALQKSDGEWTYFSSDILYQNDKINRGFDITILILGVDHGGYIKRMQAISKALNEKTQMIIKLQNIVNLVEDGRHIKMSKRAGNFFTVKEILEDFGKDVVRFMMLTKKNDIIMDFDYKVLKLQTKNNPVFYVQYAYTRICSVFRKAKELNIPLYDKDDININLINSQEELEIIRQISIFPYVIESVSKSFEPHSIVLFLIDLASLFHSLWNKGMNDNKFIFLQPSDLLLTNARLRLLHAVQIIFSIGFDLLGIEALEKM